mmetsp:Transcript_101882/g.283796  ORF Transcript_101882/g.283796 Transcript_101882/m.283796 type:complete len:204 (+) Transcript_101882:143-754(+)
MAIHLCYNPSKPATSSRSAGADGRPPNCGTPSSCKSSQFRCFFNACAKMVMSARLPVANPMGDGRRSPGGSAPRSGTPGTPGPRRALRSAPPTEKSATQAAEARPSEQLDGRWAKASMPSSSKDVGSAPAWINKAHASREPAAAAKCKACMPSSSLEDTDAFCCSSTSTIAAWPSLAARMSGVRPIWCSGVSPSCASMPRQRM